MQVFNTGVNFLRDEILLLGGTAENAIANAMRALIERDCELAQRVIYEDDEIDSLENQIDEHCTHILMENRCSSSDMFFTIAVSHTAPIIERIADHAVNIAKHALVLINEPQLKPYIDLPELARIAQQMLINGLDALTRDDCALARQTIRQDDRADELFHRIYDELVQMMERDPKVVRRAVELLFVIKHLERIADYATNICETVIYMVEGRLIKHTQEAR